MVLQGTQVPEKVRNAVEALTKACVLRSTWINLLARAEYINLDLKISNAPWVTSEVDVKNFYV